MQTFLAGMSSCCLLLLAAGCERYEVPRPEDRDQRPAAARFGAPVPGAPVFRDLEQDEALRRLLAQVREELPEVVLQDVVAKKITYADYFGRVDREFDGLTIDDFGEPDLGWAATGATVWAVGFRSAGAVSEVSWFWSPQGIKDRSGLHRIDRNIVSEDPFGGDGLATGCIAINAVSGDLISVTIAQSDWWDALCYDRLLSFERQDRWAD